MSHLYSVEQATAIAPAYHPLPRGPALADPAAVQHVAGQALRFRQLRSPAQVASVLHLRSEIRLPGSTLTDTAFAAREKKETRSVLWELSISPAA